MSRGGFRALLAAAEAGFRPAGVAVGASSFQVVQTWGCATQSRWKRDDRFAPVAFEQYETGVRSAWRTAIERLEGDAARIGAHGVVGVSVKHELDGSALQVQLTGSAVIVPDVEPLARPFLSTLSWQDSLKLLLGGWIPSGVAVGVAAVHVHAWNLQATRTTGLGLATRGKGLGWSNVEMAEATQGVMLARARAERSARRAATGFGERTVGSTVELLRTPSPCGKVQGRLVEALIFGTAVSRFRDPVTRPSGARDLTGSRG